jgi:hypothetical protein
MLFARSKAEDQLGKYVKFFLIHVEIRAADGIKFSTTSRLAAVANGGGSGACDKGFREEDTTLMEEEMFVGDVISQIAYDPGFDGMGCRAPFVCWGGKNIEAAWMRKAEFLCLDFSRSLVSVSSYVGVEQEESVVSWKCNCGREGSIRSGFVGHGVSSLMCGGVMKKGRQVS